jgi:hypothetical protein
MRSRYRRNSMCIISSHLLAIQENLRITPSEPGWNSLVGLSTFLFNRIIYTGTKNNSGDAIDVLGFTVRIRNTGSSINIIHLSTLSRKKYHLKDGRVHIL